MENEDRTLASVPSLDVQPANHSPMNQPRPNGPHQTDGHMSPFNPPRNEDHGPTAPVDTTGLIRSTSPTLDPDPPALGCRRRVWGHMRHWLHLVWLDVVLLVLVALATGAAGHWITRVYRSDHRYFPMTFDPVAQKWMGPAELSYPQSDFVISFRVAGAVAVMVPLAVFLFMQIFVRDPWDVTAASFGVLKGLVILCVFSFFFVTEAIMRITNLQQASCFHNFTIFQVLCWGFRRC